MFPTLASSCSSGIIPIPIFFGAQILSLQANVVTNASLSVPSGAYPNHEQFNVTNLSFCNVSVIYTHPGQNDSINVQVYLPSHSNWNKRIQAIGGSRYQAGLYYAQSFGMISSTYEGYATIGTDAGLGSANHPREWALLSPGNVNLYSLQNLASRSLDDAAKIGKAITASFYGKKAKYSYFTGCSQGGRQGLMLAQRFPDAYDGIAVSAPAIHWDELTVGMFWPAFLRNRLGKFPSSCEFNAITRAAIKACDDLDGNVDGIIGLPAKCRFDAQSVVGANFTCAELGVCKTISAAAEAIMNGSWSGPRFPDKSSFWHGLPKDADLTGTNAANPAVLPNICPADGRCTKSGGIDMREDWIARFVLKNADADLRNMTLNEYARIAHVSAQEYSSIIGTSDPDLSDFRRRGGKIIMYHGMADSVIPFQSSTSYYDAVTAKDPKIHDFFRLFLAPGLNHCFGGPGPYPDTTFDVLKEWVENEVAPKSLPAARVGSAVILKGDLCPYPKVQTKQQSSAGGLFICK